MQISRRDWLRTSVLSGLAAVGARAAGAQLKLGVDAYTLRAFKWNAHQLLDYSDRMKLDTIQLDLNYYESLEPAYVKGVREHAERLGISIDGSMGSICVSSSNWRKENKDPVEYLRTGLRVAHGSGATCIRVFMGGNAERTGFEKHVDNMLKTMRAVRSQALDLGVKIAIENHGDFQAWELRDLIETAGKDYVAACLDSGNAITVMEDPLVTLETLGPYVVTTHIRDSAVFEHPRGAVTQWVGLGEGSVDFKAFFARFAELCPQAGVQLEILTGGRPRVVPYLEPDHWKVYPKARAGEFARFVKLARTGQPFLGSMVIAAAGQNPEYDAALREQQRIDLERGFAAARALGVGRR